MVVNAVSLVVVLSGLGLAFGFLLAWTNKRLGVKMNPLIDEVEEELPKRQCGSCGFPGCRQYAEAVVNRPEVPPDLCVPGGNDVARLVAKLTGKAAGEVVARKVVVLCAGVPGKNCEPKHHYEGLDDCDAAVLLHGGDKLCDYGCLGLGNCVRSCQHGALTMGPDSLPTVSPEHCMGCGICVDVCPRKVLELAPAHAKGLVRCRNRDKGALTRKQCQVGCVACGICVRTCPQDAMTLKDNVAVVDYARCQVCQAPVCLVVKCSTHSIHPFYGVPVPDMEPPKPRAPRKEAVA